MQLSSTWQLQASPNQSIVSLSIKLATHQQGIRELPVEHRYHPISNLQTGKGCKTTPCWRVVRNCVRSATPRSMGAQQCHLTSHYQRLLLLPRFNELVDDGVEEHAGDADGGASQLQRREALTHHERHDHDDNHSLGRVCDRLRDCIGLLHDNRSELVV